MAPLKELKFQKSSKWVSRGLNSCKKLLNEVDLPNKVEYGLIVGKVIRFEVIWLHKTR